LIIMDKQKSKKSWVIISVLVEQELAEPVAGALSGIVPGGLVLESNYGGVFPHELDSVKVPVRIDRSRIDIFDVISSSQDQKPGLLNSRVSSWSLSI